MDKVMVHHLANGVMYRFEKFRLYHKEFLGIDLTESELADLADQFSHLVLDKVVAAPYVQGAYEFLSEYHNFYDFFLCRHAGTWNSQDLRGEATHAIL